MGSLPNALPRSPREVKKKKSPFQPNSAPELTVAPRTLEEIDAEFRGSGEMWTPFLTQFDAERVRLASGAVFWGLTTFLVHSANRGRDWKKSPRSWEAEINIAEAALWCRCDYKSVNRELQYMQQRDMAIVARLAGGRAVVRIVFFPEALGDKLFPGWAGIQLDYAAYKDSLKQAIDEQVQENESEEAAADELAAGNTYVKVKPQSIKRGKGSKSKIDAFVKSMRVECDEKSPVDINISGEVVSGELVLSVCGNETQNARSKNVAKPAESTTSQKSPGHIRPNGQKIPPNGGSQNSPHARVEKRAAELAALFDPLCKLSNSKILSGDTASLNAACQAAGDIPRAELVAFVMKRAEREISGPRACVAIVKEAVANWQAGGVGPVGAADTTRGTGDERAKQVIAGLKTLAEIRRRGRG